MYLVPLDLANKFLLVTVFPFHMFIVLFALEFKSFVENQQVCRRHWASAEMEVREMRAKITSLETENSALQARLTAAR